MLFSSLIYERGSLAQVGRDAASGTKGEVSYSQSIVACSPEKPIVRPGEAVNLRLYAASSTEKPLKYTWTAPVGRIDGKGAEARWNFTDVAVGVYEAKAIVYGAGGAVGDCSIRVAVQSQSQLATRGNRETGRTFLLPNEVETNGYGLYSYLLFGARPTASSRERYLKAIEEYLKFPDIARLETFNASRRMLNITYLPILAFPGQQILERLGDEQYGEVAEWLLKQYDYERARVVLRGISGSPRDGPYIVSFLKPPTWNGPPSRPYLYQDQSLVPPRLISLWVREFLNQAAQEQFWQERTAAQLALKLRTSVGILATGLPEVPKALNDWITWAS